MKWIFGLPAHPFVVHIPLVLVPLVCSGAIGIAARPAWRRRFGWIVVAGSALMVVAVLLAMSSGEALNQLTGKTEPITYHRQLAETSRMLVIALFVGVLALVLVGRFCDRNPEAAASLGWMRPLMIAIVVFTTAAALTSTIWVLHTGHEGTKVVWRDLIEHRNDDG